MKNGPCRPSSEASARYAVGSVPPCVQASNAAAARPGPRYPDTAAPAAPPPGSLRRSTPAHKGERSEPLGAVSVSIGDARGASATVGRGCRHVSTALLDPQQMSSGEASPCCRSRVRPPTPSPPDFSSLASGALFPSTGEPPVLRFASAEVGDRRAPAAGLPASGVRRLPSQPI